MVAVVVGWPGVTSSFSFFKLGRGPSAALTGDPLLVYVNEGKIRESPRKLGGRKKKGYGNKFWRAMDARDPGRALVEEKGLMFGVRQQTTRRL